MKRIAAGGVTALVLAAFLVAAAMRSRGPRADVPEQCLDQMYQTMKAGDVAGYLDCFAGDLRERLAREVEQQTNARFAAYLKEQVAPIKGRAVTSDKLERAGSDRVRLVVDRVYDGRPWELQAFRLRQDKGRWRIYEIEPPELHEPPVPYGAPAIPVAPNPSQGDNAAPNDSQTDQSVRLNR